jgi:prevent-host-death family protein
MSLTVNMSQAKAEFSRLVKLAEAGEDIVITRNGKPVVRLTRIKAAKPKLPWGALHGKIMMAEDFDAPLEEFKDYI